MILTALSTSSLWPSTPPNFTTQTSVLMFHSRMVWSTNRNQNKQHVILFTEKQCGLLTGIIKKIKKNIFRMEAAKHRDYQIFFFVLLSCYLWMQKATYWDPWGGTSAHWQQCHGPRSAELIITYKSHQYILTVNWNARLKIVNRLEFFMTIHFRHTDKVLLKESYHCWYNNQRNTLVHVYNLL